MLRVGLTGGIGCGKSTVAAMMRELGCHILEADKMAHEMIAPGGAAYDDVVREFGKEILDPGGFVNRPRLAAIVFQDPTRLAKLNAMIHPRVLADCEREFARLEAFDPHGVAVLEAALLIEAGYQEHLDRLVVATCTAEQQMERLTNPAFGRNMAPEEARRRIGAQLAPGDKRKLADDEVICSGSLSETRQQVEALVARLRKRAAAPDQRSGERGRTFK